MVECILTNSYIRGKREREKGKGEGGEEVKRTSLCVLTPTAHSNYSPLHHCR